MSRCPGCGLLIIAVHTNPDDIYFFCPRACCFKSGTAHRFTAAGLGKLHDMGRIFLVTALLVVYYIALVQAAFDPATLRCHDPAQGSTTVARNKKFLLIAGAGAGMGNFLIFFPAAYYFAALTGRVSLVKQCVLYFD